MFRMGASANAQYLSIVEQWLVGYGLLLVGVGSVPWAPDAFNVMQYGPEYSGTYLRYRRYRT